MILSSVLFWAGRWFMKMPPRLKFGTLIALLRGMMPQSKNIGLFPLWLVVPYIQPEARAPRGFSAYTYRCPTYAKGQLPIPLRCIYMQNNNTPASYLSGVRRGVALGLPWRQGYLGAGARRIQGQCLLFVLVVLARCLLFIRVKQNPLTGRNRK
jgi:hypothetical protein